MDLRLSKSVQRVSLLGQDPSGRVTPIVIYKKQQKKRKKGAAGLRYYERAVRRLARAQQAFAGSYAGKHDKSNQKRRDGWIRDYPLNVAKDTRRGAKRLGLNRFVPF